jgi:hypothetical protein
MKKIFTLIFAFCFVLANSQNACTHTFNMYDSYGDGWTGAFVDVSVNGITVVSAATGVDNGNTNMPGPCGTENFQASSVDAITLSNWVSGSYDSEISWDIKDDNGTIIASGGTMVNGGGYGMLANCNGSCSVVTSPSWDCNANGTCSDPGNGSGQYSTQAACVSSCVLAPSWQCDHTFNMYDSLGDGWNGVTVDITVNGVTVATSTLASGSSGTENFQAFGGDTIDLTNWTFGSQPYSQTTQISWDIKDGDGNIIAGVNSNTGNNVGGFGGPQYTSTFLPILGFCSPPASWDCNANGTCSDPGTGLGQYSTQAACVSSCVVTPSWDCDGSNGTCSDPGDGSGQYSTQSACISACIVTPSWDCDGTNGTCYDPGNGSGQYSTQTACVSACIVTPSWDCDGTNGTCSDPGNGSGQYSTQSACISACIVTPSWDCDPTSGTCSDPGNASGQYGSLSACLSACVAPTSWNCDPNGITCSDPGNGSGSFSSQSACLSLSTCAPIVSMNNDVPVHFMIFTDRTGMGTPSSPNPMPGVSVSIAPHVSNPRNYLNPGKIVRFKAGVTNLLSTNLTSALITLSSTFNDPYVTIINNQVGLNNITSNETEFTLTEFEISIDSSCPPGHIFYANFEIVNQITSTTYNSTAYPISIEPFVNVEQTVPGLSPGTMIDDDTNPDSDGDDDHVVDANEIIEITPQLAGASFDITNLTDFGGSFSTTNPFPGREAALSGCFLNLNNYSYINIWDNVPGATGANVVSCLPDFSIANSNWYVQPIQNTDYLLPGYDFVFDFNHNITCKFDLFIEFEAAISWHETSFRTYNDRKRWLSKITINPNRIPCPILSWDCDANGMCFDPGTGQGQYLSQAACLSACVVTPSWDCDISTTNCFDPGTGQGQYSTLTACLNACVVTPSWNCNPTNGTCSDPGTGQGQYSTQSACLSACASTPSWDCDISNLTCSDPGTGQGQFSTQSACLSACVSTNTFSYTINSTKIFPNPFKEKAVLEFQDKTTQSVLLFDVMGKLLREYEDISNNKLIIERGSLSSGTYILKIINENSIIMQRIIIE